MPFCRRRLALPALLVLIVALGACANQGSDRGRYYTRQSDPASCIAASDFSKCRFERDKVSLAPTVRAGRR